MELTDLVKRCASCQTDKTLADFGKDKRNRDGLRYSCRSCRSEEGRIWRAQNKESIQAYKLTYRSKPENRVKALSYERKWRMDNRLCDNEAKARWAKAHPEYSRMANHRYRCKKMSNGVFDITPRDLARLQESACVVCGDMQTTIDHVIPIALGGRHSIGNLQSLCKSCNSSKQDKFMFQWLLLRRAG